MPDPSLFDRLKRAHLVRVLGVYLGASWGILQVADLLQAIIGLPEWIVPAAAVLLLAGVVIITATALVQARPETTAREEAGELPTDWEVDPADIIASVRAGRLPHLTWGRTVVGGLLAFWFLFGLAGVWVLVAGGRVGLGPEEIAANEAATGVAVLPFDVRGDGLEIWREGMVDLLTTALDGVGGMRTIDSRTVLARWEETVGDASTVDLQMALNAAGRTGARYGISGNAVALGPDVRLSADLYDLSDGSKVAQGTAEGPAESVLAVADELALDLMRDFLAESESQAIAPQRLASLTTSSLPAMRSFLEGEALFRKGRLTDAIASYEEALEADSTFAMALFRLYQSYGWVQSVDEDVTRDIGDRLKENLDGLTVRDRAILQVDLSVGDFTLWDGDRAEDLVVAYPDDPEAWNTLGEAMMHESGPARGGITRSREAFERAVELSPAFAPYYFHAVELAIGAGEPDRARELITALAALTNDDLRVAAYRFSVWAYFEAGAEEAADSLGALDDVEWPGLEFFAQLPESPPLTMRWRDMLLPIIGELQTPDVHAQLAELAVATGRIAEARQRLAAMAELEAHGPGDGLPYELDLLVGGVAPEVLERHLGDGACGTDRHAYMECTTAAALYAADHGRLDRTTRQAAEDREIAESLVDEGEDSHAAMHRALGIALEGVVAWKRGDLEQAWAKLDSAVRMAPPVPLVAMRLAELEIERGRPGAAIGVFNTLQDHLMYSPYAYFRIGEIMEGRAYLSGAREAYEMALTAWGDADADFTPKARAEEALARMGGG